MTARVPFGPGAVVPPPTPTPGLHSLIASAVQANDGARWEEGFQFWPENCVVASAWWPGCDDTDSTGGDPEGGNVNKSAPPTNNPPQTYLPATFESAFQCDATGWEAIDYEGRAKRQIQAALSNALEYEFWTGTLIPENYNLVGSTPVVPVTPGVGVFGGVLNTFTSGSFVAMRPQDALAALVGALASCGPGSRGMIHAPATIAELWAETFSLVPQGQLLTTKTRGNVVVSGGGYPGTGPAGLATYNSGSAASQATPSAGQAWVYATDMVYVRVGIPVVVPDTFMEARVRDQYGHLTAQVEYRGEIVAAAYVGSCCSFAVLVDTTDST